MCQKLDFFLLRVHKFFDIVLQSFPYHAEPYDFFRFTKHGFKYIIEKEGVELVEISENGGMWSVTGQYFLKNIYNEHPKRNKILRVFFNIFKKINGIYLLNFLFEYLDKIDYNPVNTINYVVVARKK